MNRTNRYFIFCMLLIFLFTDDSYAQSDANQQLYQKAIQIILEKERPNHFFIFEQTIPATTFTTIRVPKQDTGAQFRSLKNLTPELELNFIYANLVTPVKATKRDYLINKFDDHFAGVISGGFVNKEILLNEESRATEESKAKNQEPPLDAAVIGFSQIGFGNVGQEKRAIFYGELCLLAPAFGSSECSANAFLYVFQSGEWTLKENTQLWSAAVKPFWKF